MHNQCLFSNLINTVWMVASFSHVVMVRISSQPNASMQRAVRDGICTIVAPRQACYLISELVAYIHS